MQGINIENHERFVNIPKNGETRMCLDPWSKVFIKFDGTVALCCNAPPVGSLLADSLDDILKGPEAAVYRHGLLEADLPNPCKICPDRNTTSTQRLKEIVELYLNGNTAILDKMESL